MKKLVLIIFILCIQFSNAQVGIGTSDPNKSAQLEVLSSEKGLLIPRLLILNLVPYLCVFKRSQNLYFFYSKPLIWFIDSEQVV